MRLAPLVLVLASCSARCRVESQPEARIEPRFEVRNPDPNAVEGVGMAEDLVRGEAVLAAQREAGVDATRRCQRRTCGAAPCTRARVQRFLGACPPGAIGTPFRCTLRVIGVCE
jgi:hypothetical protein